MPASYGRGNRLNYNGTTVHDVLTKSVSEEVVYDPSNTDRVATKVTITLNGLLSVAAMDDGGPATVDRQDPASPETEGSRFDYTLNKLNDNRKWFIYWVGDDPLYAIWPIEFWHLRHRDIDDAPSGVTEDFVAENWWSAGLYDSAKIQTSIVNIVSDRTARVEIALEFTFIPCKVYKGYSLETTVGETDPTDGVATEDDHSGRVGDTLETYSPQQDQRRDEYWGSEYDLCASGEDLMTPTWRSVLSNRWRTGDNINTEDWLCERSISGTIEIVGRVGSINSMQATGPDSDTKKAPISPHYVRFLTIPPLQNGFKRQNLKFTEQEDNLKLDYEIVDKEVYVQAPWPACTFEATCSTSIKPLSGGMGAMPLVKVECSMAGRKHVDKKLLLQAMVHVMNTKTNFLQTYATFTSFPSAMEITESLSSNTIRGNLEVMIKPDESGSNPFQSVMKFLTATFGQGTSIGQKGHKRNDHLRGLTSETIRQKQWGAREKYDPQKARADLQYPDDCYLLGPLSSLFMPAMLGRHGLNNTDGEPYTDGNTGGGNSVPLSYVGNSACDPIISYDTKPKKVVPITRTASLNQTGFYDGHGKNFSQDDYSRDQWRKKGKTTSPASLYQEAPLAGRDFILSGERINPSLGTAIPKLKQYLSYIIKVQYEIKSGREMVTAANPKLPFTLPHAKTRPMAYKTYTFFSARLNARPVLPYAADFVEVTSNLAHYLVDAKYNFANPIASTTGINVLYVASGQLIFCLPRPHHNNEPIFNPTAPFVKGQANDQPELNFISINNFAYLNDRIFSGF